MRFRETSALMLMIIAIMMFVSVTPVSARTAPAVTGSVTISGGTATYRVQRNGWRVNYEVTVRDSLNDGRCAYARLDLDVDGGIDRGIRASDVCGFNKSRKFTGSIVAMNGYGLRAIKVRICINRNMLTDPCSMTTKSIPQHTKGSLTSAQFNELNRIYNLSLSNFLNERRKQTAPFDWTHNGCSTWKINSAPYRTKFLNACIRHDFGYRNYGGQKYYLHTDSMRQTIDLKFYNDMLAICGSNSSCKISAKGYYAAVRMAGGKYFAGQ